MWKIPLEQSFSCFDRFPDVEGEIELIFFIPHTLLILKNQQT